MANELIDVFNDFFEKNNRFIGFNDFFNMGLENKGFPPYDVYTDTAEYKHTFFEVALAGFKEKDIEVTFSNKTHELKIVGEKNKDEPQEPVNWLHKGIGERNFTLCWQLQPNLVFEKMSFDDGILKIEFSESKCDDLQVLKFT